MWCGVVWRGVAWCGVAWCGVSGDLQGQPLERGVRAHVGHIPEAREHELREAGQAARRTRAAATALHQQRQ